MQGAVEGQDLQKFRATAGGVKKVENVKINVDREKAYVEADIDSWAKFLENSGKSIEGAGGMAHYTFRLVKKEGKWKIIGESFNYLPGQGP